LARVEWHIVSKVSVTALVNSKEEKIKHGMNDGHFCLIGSKIGFRNIGNMLPAIDQDVIPCLIPVRLGLIGFIPFIRGLTGFINGNN
jgi:hypothetical protein